MKHAPEVYRDNLHYDVDYVKGIQQVISSYLCTTLQILSSSLLCNSFCIHGRVLALEKASPEAKDSVEL